MGWLKRMFDSGERTLCGGCKSTARSAGTVEAGGAKVDLCSNCWGILLANESKLERIVEDHKKRGHLSRDADDPLAGFTRCLNCASGITNETAVVVVFHRPRKSGEKVVNLYGDRKAPVAVILGFCAPCANKFVPGANFRPGEHQ
jgi:hypothetical protein